MPPFDLDPLSEMQGASMEHVDVLRWQEVHHEHDECTHPHETDVLADPPNVIVNYVLKDKSVFDRSDVTCDNFNTHHTVIFSTILRQFLLLNLVFHLASI